tara:strand:+ start:952 stop:1554 length:603 start_codon:yes stop_codon:yes gene_type:complete
MGMIAAMIRSNVKFVRNGDLIGIQLGDDLKDLTGGADIPEMEVDSVLEILKEVSDVIADLSAKLETETPKKEKTKKKAEKKASEAETDAPKKSKKSKKAKKKAKKSKANRLSSEMQVAIASSWPHMSPRERAAILDEIEIKTVEKALERGELLGVDLNPKPTSILGTIRDGIEVVGEISKAADTAFRLKDELTWRLGYVK